MNAFFNKSYKKNTPNVVFFQTSDYLCIAVTKKR